ncbi:helix-turn-helix transcriptional regulator [Cohnella sp. GCM10020058]|uniref:helix-turn-helix transcriptional regulator n=1 Tax=Cohnella sp. GCM10020058 TaxID=3317330 RepID=UPI003645B7E7
MEPANGKRQQELALFLKTRRARLTPEQVGLPGGGRRRTPGLRREEVAMLAGVSADWYKWLEQARDIQASAQVLDSIAAALQLDATERRHLYLLALRQLPADPQPNDGVVPRTLRRFLELQAPSPAIATDQRMDVVAWNRPAGLIYGDYGAMPQRERNTVWRTFTSSYVRELLREGWEPHARHRLAQFRAGYARYAGDPWWLAMIEELARVSAEFREWWPTHDVLIGPEGTKRNYHPTAGLLVFEQAAFTVSNAPHLTVIVNMPSPEGDTAARLERLSNDPRPAQAELAD